MPRSPSVSRSPSPRGAASRSPSPDGPSKRKRQVILHCSMYIIVLINRSLTPISRDRSPSPPSRRRRSISPSRPNGEAIPSSGNGTVSKVSEQDKDAAAKAEFTKMLGTRTGGAYIPPARLRAMQAEAAKDKTSAEYQRLSWDALRKSINGMINKVRCSLYGHLELELINRSTCRISNTSYPNCLART